MKRCHIFDYEDAAEAGMDLSYSVLKNYGDECDGNPLYVWDDGERFLARCEKCGCLILVQKSEYHGIMDDDSYYTDYFSVSSEAEAEELNRKWSGFEIEVQFPHKYLRQTNGKFSFNTSKR